MDKVEAPERMSEDFAEKISAQEPGKIFFQSLSEDADISAFTAAMDQRQKRNTSGHLIHVRGKTC